MDFKSFERDTEEIFSLNRGLPSPSSEQTEKLFRLTEIMLEVNKHMNLTAITEQKAVILKHYADSLTVSSFIPEGVSLIDVGCGAGFPTLPLAIFRPDLTVTALDGTAKRIEYVRRAASELGLDNVTAIAARAEELGGGEFREKFDVATARAVASLPVLSELCLPFVKVGGIFAAMKASHASEELTLSKNAIKLCGGALRSVNSVNLTSDGENFEQRSIICVDKISSTPKIYPRHYSKISKKPL